MTKASLTKALLLCAAVISTRVFAAETTVSQLLSNPTAFDGKHVTVAGTAEAVKPSTSRSGYDYETFNLCQESCVNVFTVGHPRVPEGRRMTVKGRFKAVQEFGPYTFHDEVDADAGSL